MLQGPTAARAKELRMESGRGGPIVINNNYISPGGKGGGGGNLIPLMAGGLASLAAMIAGALAQPETAIIKSNKSTGKQIGRSTQFSERGGERA